LLGSALPREELVGIGGDSIVFVEASSSLSVRDLFDIVIGAGARGGGGGGGGGSAGGVGGGGGGTAVGLVGKLVDVVVVKILLLLDITLFIPVELDLSFEVTVCAGSISLPFK